MREPLASIAAEREILGSILTDPADLYKVSPILRQDDFYRQDYRLLYGLMSEMILQGGRPDLVTLTETAKEKGANDLPAIVRSISDLGIVGRTYSIEKKAETVAEYARRRRLIARAKELEATAADCSQNVDELAETFTNDLQGMSYRASKSNADMGAAFMELMATLERREKGEAMTTGLADLDRIITGFEPGQLVIIAGRPGHGKSALAGTITINLARRGRKILLCSMEMGKGEVAGRFVSRLASIPGNVLKVPGKLTREQRAAIAKAGEILKTLPITINTQGNLTVNELAGIAIRQKRTTGLDLLIVDYLQLMSGGKKADISRVQEISAITRAMKNLAVSLEIPILLLSQLSRASDKESRPPKLTDLRDSGSIEQDANTVILLHREPGKYGGLSAKTTANVAKQRDGNTDSCTLFFATSLGYFDNYDCMQDIPY